MVRGPVDMSELVRKLSGQRAGGGGGGGAESSEEEAEEEEGGAHDTITSLAGAHLLQKFSRIGSSRDRKQFRGYKNNDLKGSITQLENLFKEEVIDEEDEKVMEDPEEPDKEAEDDVFVPPDGGYGWFVALGAFNALFWTAGLVKSYGVLFSEMLSLYPGNIALASWIPAVMTTTALAMAPVASGLCQRFNCRYVTALGSVLAFIGVTLSAVLPSLQALFVSLGMLTGAGIGLATTPGIILTARYFDKRRSLANALCLSGTAAGSCTLPLLISALLDRYGFQGALLVLGACLLHVCVSAALYRPLATHVLIIRARQRALGSSPAPGPALAAAAQPPAAAEVEASNNNKEAALPPLDPGSEAGCGEAPLSSSLPAHTLLGTPCSAHRFLSEECSLAAKRSSIHSSFDSISMLSSVSASQDCLDTDPERDAVFCPAPAPAPGTRARHVSSVGSVASTGLTLQERRDSAGNAKSLSLRELALHQIGSHLSLYRSMLVGARPAQPPAAREDTCAHHKLREAAARVTSPRRSSYMFSVEDIMVDSTSVLKDSRHPSHAHLDRGETHRVVNLNRTQSAVGEIKCRKQSGRQRFYSENTFTKGGLSRNSSFCRRSLAGARTELIGSTELHAASASASPVPGSRRGKFTLQPVVAAETEAVTVAEARSLGDKSQHLLDTVNKYIKLSLVRDPVFILLTGSVMFMAIGVPHCLFFLPSHAKHVGLPVSDASLLLSISAIFDLAGRLSLGFILDLNLFPKYIGYSFMMFISGISAILLPSTQTFTQVAICMGFYGLGTGGWFLMVPLLLAENLGVENIASSYGLARLFQSITNFCGPILAGFLMDLTGNPSSSFYFMGTSMAIGSFIIMLLPSAIKKHDRIGDCQKPMNP